MGPTLNVRLPGKEEFEKKAGSVMEAPGYLCRKGSSVAPACSPESKS